MRARLTKIANLSREVSQVTVGAPVEGIVFMMPKVGHSFELMIGPTKIRRTSTVLQIIDPEHFETLNAVYRLELLQDLN